VASVTEYLHYKLSIVQRHSEHRNIQNIKCKALFETPWIILQRGVIFSGRLAEQILSVRECCRTFPIVVRILLITRQLFVHQTELLISVYSLQSILGTAIEFIYFYSLYTSAGAHPAPFQLIIEGMWLIILTYTARISRTYGYSLAFIRINICTYMYTLILY
jgi:hypothetical protein